MSDILLSQNLQLERCPHCKIDNPNLHELHRLETKDHQNSNKKKWIIYVCRRCGRLVTAASRDFNLKVIEYYPSLNRIDENIPSPAYDYLQQANDTIHSPSGSILLSASAIDSMLKIKGYTSGNLYTRINKAAKEHLITQEMSKWAHKVRLNANEQRHADEDSGLPTIEDAQNTLEFTKALAQFLFVLPSKIADGIKASSTEDNNES